MIFSVKLHSVAWFTQKKTENSPGSFVFRFFFSGSMCVFFPEYMFPYLDGDGHLRTDQSLSATEIWS
jgi:hypothetical protein